MRDSRIKQGKKGRQRSDPDWRVNSTGFISFTTESFPIRQGGQPLIHPGSCPCLLTALTCQGEGDM